jgi:serine/threonine protein kinase
VTLDNNKAHELFNAARNLPSAEREPLLDKECGDDDALRVEVEALLKHHDFTSANTEDSGYAGGLTVDYEPGDMIGKFKIIGVLGEGGMGIVYLAEQSKPVKRRVALKVIKAGMDTKQVIARFEAERQALAIMNHPGIAQVYESGATKEGRPYFVLEFVKGRPITEACDEHKQTTKQRLELLAKVCDAVQHAHTKGIIHRDLKPSNILVSVGENDVLEPKIIDFGVAKATNQQLTDKTLVTQVGRFIGTPAYMSPEQADLKATDIDTRTDVYALGVVTYEVLTGSPPFDPQTLREAGLEGMREIIRTQPPLKPSTQLSSIDDEDAIKIANTHRIQIRELAGLLRKELEWIPLKALKKQRSERYDSPKSMADDIRRYLKGEALEAGPETLLYRVRKRLRRHKKLVAATTVMIALLFVGIYYALEARNSVLLADRERVRTMAMTEFATRALSPGLEVFPTELQKAFWKSHLEELQLQIESLFFQSPQLQYSMYRALGGCSIAVECLGSDRSDLYYKARDVLINEFGNHHTDALLCNLQAEIIKLSAPDQSEEDLAEVKGAYDLVIESNPNTMQKAKALQDLSRFQIYDSRYFVREEGQRHAREAESLYLSANEDIRRLACIQNRIFCRIYKDREFPSGDWSQDIKDKHQLEGIDIIKTEYLPLAKKIGGGQVSERANYVAKVWLGRAFANLSLPEQSIPIEKELLEFQLKKYGEASNRAWQMMNNLAISYCLAAKLTEDEGEKIELEKEASMLWGRILELQRRYDSTRSVEEYMETHTWYINSYRAYLEEYAPNDEQYRKLLEAIRLNPSDFKSPSLHEQGSPIDSIPD